MIQGRPNQPDISAEARHRPMDPVAPRPVTPNLVRRLDCWLPGGRPATGRPRNTDAPKSEYYSFFAICCYLIRPMNSSGKTPSRIVTLSIVFVALAAAVVVCWMLLAGNSPTTTVSNAATVSTATTSPSHTISASHAASPPGVSAPPPTDNPALKTPNPSTSPSAEFTVSFTALNLTSDQLQVRVLIDSVIGEGTCTLTLASGSRTETRESGIQALVSSSTCKGFDLPRSVLPTGSVTATVTVTSAGTTARATQTMTIGQ